MQQYFPIMGWEL